MTFAEANKIKIVDFLTKSGIEPAFKKGNKHWYRLRNENTPSCVVDTENNTYHDFGGGGSGGGTVDLVCWMENQKAFGALLVLSGYKNIPQPLSFKREKVKVIAESILKINHVQSLQNQALIQYLESRKIPFKIAKQYIEEAYYSITNKDTGEVKNYFAVAFRNDENGFELRSKYFKGGTSPKTITTIPVNLKSVNVFEGFMDYLSALVYYKTISPANTTIVLNSTSNIRHLYDLLPNFSKINLYLDNDPTGIKTTSEIICRCPVAVNQSAIIYPEFKDFNEFIMSL